MITLYRICWGILLLTWMIVIYFFSDQANSNETTEEIFGSLNYWVRKGAHMTEYAILFYLLFAFCNSLLRKRRGLYSSRCLKSSFFLECMSPSKPRLASSLETICIPMILSVLYAFSDEWHQSFVPGRSAVFSDVLIDACGVMIAVGITIVSSFIRR